MNKQHNELEGIFNFDIFNLLRLKMLGNYICCIHATFICINDAYIIYVSYSFYVYYGNCLLSFYVFQYVVKSCSVLGICQVGCYRAFVLTVASSYEEQSSKYCHKSKDRISQKILYNVGIHLLGFSLQI